MKISIIIPVLNEGSTIRRSIENARSRGGDEVIIVDGGSTDDSMLIARDAISSRSDCRIITSAPSRSIQMNAGAAAATGDLFLFLHADTRLIENGCQQIRDAMESRCSIEWGGFKQRIESRGLIYRMIETGNAMRANYRGLVYGDQGFFVTRSRFESSGPFDEVPFLEDYMFSKKLATQSVPMTILRGPLFVDARRWEKNGAVRQTIRNWSIIRAFRNGATPEELLSMYPRHDKS